MNFSLLRHFAFHFNNVIFFFFTFFIFDSIKENQINFYRNSYLPVNCKIYEIFSAFCFCLFRLKRIECFSYNFRFRHYNSFEIHCIDFITYRLNISHCFGSNSINPNRKKNKEIKDWIKMNSSL